MNELPPTQQNTFVAIITYNPDIRLLESVEVIKKIFRNIIIIDNNSSFNVKTFINNNLHYIINNDNLGIAKALNIGAEYAIKHGARWLLMLDQDSIPRVDILSIYNSVYLSYPDKKKIGQIGVSFSYKKSNKRIYYKVTTLITSGSLLSIDVYKIIGGFRNNLFIDSVDFEYSLRIKEAGFVNLLSPEVGIQHRLGNYKERKILFFTIRSTNHPPQRRYYMARNHIDISLQFISKYPIWVIKKNYFFFKSILEIILVDDHKILKIRNTFSGLIDGIFRIKNYLL